MINVSDNTDCMAPLYEQVAVEISALIEQGTFRVGDRVPSIRQLSRRFEVSINTVMQAYALLEDRRLIEARPQSGYYVRARAPEISEPELPHRHPIEPASVTATISDLCQEVIKSRMNRDLLPLGSAVPHPQHLPVDKLNRLLASESRRFPDQSISYQPPRGSERLRVQIAQRSLMAGISARPDEIFVTSGCVEAVLLALRATCQPGDTIAVESPFYFNFLQLIAELGLKALEVPATPREGISIEALRYVISQNRIKACLIVPNFSNPLGSLMPAERKRELVELLATHEIPLIEDDIYGDLVFGKERPVAAKSFDRRELVIYCTSISKTLAPGYRVGWAVAGRFQPEMERLKMMMNLATSSPPQLALAEFLATGGYDHHLRTVRRIYAGNISRMADAVARYFPAGTRMTRPSGGFMLWVEMPEGCDAIKLYHRALGHGISIAPGPLFSLTGKYPNHIRLSSSLWDERIEQGIKTLGTLAQGLL
ncbi:PLP-dependent aminotransferase family protein [Geobacter sp. SVR]|uniref:aminotransferase-like domain-containing protein n=1 Tax=Geobacter sp. SVR TaxID=2495594 RepID=UPI00143F007D|nr:PLP-dependent aminotransferase family protein [Geobacter sp. SVR]BCS52854.1 GntR family transcriptional regulator [Geobacter sp. SVR]GCF86721.1 GntR family transcriptional regulator [Geobacter sp. SVR]